ncbi:hypothetical protein ABZ078_03310 [Streptomyces sp. NPDC006385]
MNVLLPRTACDRPLTEPLAGRLREAPPRPGDDGVPRPGAVRVAAV